MFIKHTYKDHISQLLTMSQTNDSVIAPREQYFADQVLPEFLTKFIKSLIKLLEENHILEKVKPGTKRIELPPLTLAESEKALAEKLIRWIQEVVDLLREKGFNWPAEGKNNIIRFNY